jgi:hypothetical protein
MKTKHVHLFEAWQDSLLENNENSAKAAKVVESLIPLVNKIPTIEEGPALYEPVSDFINEREPGKITSEHWKTILQGAADQIRNSKDDYVHFELVEAESKHGTESSDGDIYLEYDEASGLQISYSEEWYNDTSMEKYTFSTDELFKMLKLAVDTMIARSIKQD